MILVITRPGDVHAQHIINILKERGEDVATFDYGRFLNNSSVSFGISTGRSWSNLSLDKGVDVIASSVKSVYNRRRRPIKLRHQAPRKSIRDYIVRESEQFLEALPELLPCYWLSHPDAIQVADRKPWQLMVASRLGFAVPRTLITNSPQQASAFVSELAGPHLAVKTLRSPNIVLQENRGKKSYSLFTRKVLKQEVLGGIEAIQNCPMIFQEYVEKDFELRITVVGNDVFACSINSQDSNLTKEDWRRYDFENVSYTPFDLHQEIREKCVGLVKALNLGLGCIDMAVTPDGNYVFFEINPNGQWLGIEKVAGLPISEAIVAQLTGTR